MGIFVIGTANITINNIMLYLLRQVLNYRTCLLLCKPNNKNVLLFMCSEK